MVVTHLCVSGAICLWSCMSTQALWASQGLAAARVSEGIFGRGYLSQNAHTHTHTHTHTHIHTFKHICTTAHTAAQSCRVATKLAVQTASCLFVIFPGCLFTEPHKLCLESQCDESTVCLCRCVCSCMHNLLSYGALSLHPCILNHPPSF